MIIKTPSDSVIQGCVGVIGAPRLLFGRDRRAIDSPALFVKIAEAIDLTPPPFRFDRAGGRVLFGPVGAALSLGMTPGLQAERIPAQPRSLADQQHQTQRQSRHNQPPQRRQRAQKSRAHG
ncbi:hypothetical protein ABC365_03185 [Brevundimonas sp. 3P9-tot-E]|uniref:hypothetical protein n=1 Tax=Brevundimonas TaxID=41275 RepID=UPI001902C68F|nr:MULTISPECIES: hypothetical protein [Brevundimonas]MBK1977088.1 hypothetical protein [Brevundimonas diminuta]MDA0744027.1 hypothetical protein [Pseudomonadota bacterium]